MYQIVKSVLTTISAYRQNVFFALLASGLLTSSFPKIGADWLIWIALVPLFYALNDLSPKQAFLVGVISGVGHFYTLLYWLIPFLMKFGYLSVPLSMAAALGLAMYLALFFGFFALIFSKCGNRYGIAVFLMPVSWVSLEFLRSHLLTGFPWELFGYSQFNRLHLIQISDIFGVLGVSFLILLSNITLYLILIFFTGRSWYGRDVSGKAVIRTSGLTILIFILVFCYGYFRIQTVSDEISSAGHLRIGVVQGNISQEVKWNSAYQVSTIEKYLDLSVSLKASHPDCVVWPETAMPFYLFGQRDKDLTDRVLKGVKTTGAHFLIGSPAFEYRDTSAVYYNRAYFVSPEGQQVGWYDKVHLVPFGEYVPLKKYLPFIDKIVEPVGNYIGGEKGKVIWWDHIGVGTLICFEVIFPDLARKLAENGAAFFANITNDAWYGRSGGPYQHFSMIVFRAIENRRALVRSANTGISGFVDPLGRVMDKTRLEEDAAMVRRIPVMHGETLYMRLGDSFAVLCLIVTILSCVYLEKERRKKICHQN